ncbi:hypothetical protein K1719_009829 [Acacia pycnantha]|nr:hypothetical protein K1719_032199 [Acacia pycnantha]KAI9119154.1 hypothetical protein K1719_009829 [Acacia pycnantha]
MKGSRFSRFHRTQLLLRFQKKMVAAAAAAATSSSVTLCSVRTWTPLSCCPGSSFLRQMAPKGKDSALVTVSFFVLPVTESKTHPHPPASGELAPSFPLQICGFDSIPDLFVRISRAPCELLD